VNSGHVNAHEAVTNELQQTLPSSDMERKQIQHQDPAVRNAICNNWAPKKKDKRDISLLGLLTDGGGLSKSYVDKLGTIHIQCNIALFYDVRYSFSVLLQNLRLPF